MSDLQVAQTILQQLGGGKFVAMTGANRFVGSDNELTFRIPQASRKINRVKITLTPMDTYTVEFTRVTRSNVVPNIKVVSTVEDVYCDQLQAIFTRETGLYTSL